MAEADHPVHGVEIDGAKVKILCGCGWKSKAATNETEARKLHKAHFEKDD